MGKQILCALLPFVLMSCHSVDSSALAGKAAMRARLAVPPEGFQQASIQTALGNFERPVLINSGKIDCVQWSNEQCVPFYGELYADGTASGTLQTGDVVTLSLIN